MFYSLELLQKRGGQFGIIWMAATEGAKLNKRQITAVRLNKVCNDIIDYIMVRMPQPPAGQARKRFSLYLSSQLMYGVVKVYHRQNDYLLNDATTFMARLRLASTYKEDIDLRETVSGDMVTLPDPLDLYDLDTDYYDMELGQLPAPTKTQFAHEKLRYPSFSEIDEMLLPDPAINIVPLKPEDVIGSPNTVSSLDEITIKQAPLPTMQTIEEDLLMGFPDTILDQVPSMDNVHAPGSPVVPVTTDIPIIPVQETPIVRPDQQTDVNQKRKPSPDVTPERPKTKERKKKSSMKLVLEDIEVGPPKVAKIRKNRKLIIDRNMVISRETFKKNIQHPNTSTTLTIPHPKRRRVEDEFILPGRELPAPLLKLFQRNCRVPETMLFSETDYSSTETGTLSPLDQLILSSPPVPQPPADLPQPPADLPQPPVITSPLESSHQLDPRAVDSLEMVRDTSVDLSLDKMASLDQSSLEGSISLDQSKPLEVLVEDIQVSRAREITVVLEEEEENITTEAVEVPTRHSPPSTPPRPFRPEPELTTRQFIRSLRDATDKSKSTTFKTLIPTTFSKITAAKMFAVLLEQCAKGRILTKQERFYGDIFISRSAV